MVETRCARTAEPVSALVPGIVRRRYPLHFACLIRNVTQELRIRYQE